MTPALYIGNQNYSSWSLRPWLVLRWAKLDFELHKLQLGGPGYGQRRIASVLAVSPSGTVPALQVDGATITDSLAIAEWAAESVPSLWPRDRLARAQARSAACEIHSGFLAMRSQLPCNLRRRAQPRRPSEEVLRDIERVEEIWSSLRARYGAGGPYLFGAEKTIADAFYLPVATRFRTYGIELQPDNQRYASTLLADPDFLEWEAAALVEPWTMPQWDDA